MEFIVQINQAKRIAAVAKSASTDKMRPILNGLYVEWNEDAIQFVATDSYQITRRTLPWNLNGLAGANPEGSGSVLVDGRQFVKAINAAVAHKLPLLFMVEDGAEITVGDTGAQSVSTLRDLGGTFPNFTDLGIDLEHFEWQNIEQLGGLNPHKLISLLQSVGTQAKDDKTMTVHFGAFPGSLKRTPDWVRRPVGVFRVDDTGQVVAALMPVTNSESSVLDNEARARQEIAKAKAVDEATEEYPNLKAV